MENESEVKLHTLIVNSSSTCIKNVYSEIFSSERKIKSSYNRGTFMDPHALSKQQEMITAAMCCEECKSSSEPLCHVKLESVDKLKESTKQLLCLLEEIQSKTQGKNIINDIPSKFTNYMKTFSQASEDTNNEICDIVHNNEIDGLKLLEANANKLDAIYIENEHDNCSVYRRLTRKCHCLNNPDYNDFVIHFNEDSKYTTSNLGEIIKNMRILRKFLYMGGSYTRNALMFLNEGMMESPHSERVEMTQACVNADICNIFDDYSIVIVCISWPCKNKYYGDYVTQALAAGFLYKLAQLEEGRRYLNYSSKITNDIKKVMRKKSDTIEVDTLESLNATLNLLKPVFAKNVAVSYFKNSIYKGVGKRTICDLVHLRKFMTYDEVLMNLEMLDTYSQYDSGRTELTSLLPLILILFKHLIMEYDNSEINIPVTNILTSIVSNKLVKQNEPGESDTTIMVLTETGTQATKNMKSEECQFPQKKNTKKHSKSKSVLGIASNKFGLPAKRQVADWETSNLRIINRSIKFKNGNKQ